jgi:hypothetical protein
MEDGPQFKFLMGIVIAPSTSKKQVPFLQEVIQADAAHMVFGKYTLFSACVNMVNGNMSPLGLAMLFGNNDKDNWTNFWKFIKKTHPIVDQPKKPFLIDQDKGSLLAITDIISLVGHFHCSFHRRQNIVKQCGGGKGHKPLIALWMYDLLCSCKSLALITATKKSTRLICTPLTIITYSPLLMKCNSQPPGVLRENQFTCTGNPLLLEWKQ